MEVKDLLSSLQYGRDPDCFVKQKMAGISSDHSCTHRGFFYYK